MSKKDTVTRTPEREKATFAQNLVRIRLSIEMSQKALARAMGRSTRTIRRWEDAADTVWPKQAVLPTLARVLNCSIDELFSYEPKWIPRTQTERELLKVARKGKQNVPIPMLANALSLVLVQMTDEQRLAWMKMGNWIVDGNPKKKE